MAIANSKAAAIGFIPIILIASLFGGYLAFASPTASLELRVGINSTNLHAGQSLNITVSLFNPLSTSSEISIPRPTASSGLKFAGFPVAILGGGGCLFPWPVEFIIVKGDYSLAELEQLSINSSSPSVICPEGGMVTHLAIQAHSDVANFSEILCTGVCQPKQVYYTRLASNFTVNGYWTYPLNSSKAQDMFSPGEYTLAVADIFYQTQLLYFTVT